MRSTAPAATARTDAGAGSKHQRGTPLRGLPEA